MSAPRSVRRLVAWILFESHVELLELWTGVNAIMWGLWIGNPFVNVFGAAPGYRTIAAFPAWCWGGVALAAGVLQITGGANGRPSYRRAGARTLACLWMAAAAGLAWENWRFLSTVTYPMLGLASLLVSYRAHTYPQTSPHAPGRRV